MIKKIYKTFAGIFSAGVLSLLALIVYAQLSLPDTLYVTEGEELSITPHLSLISVGNTDPKVSADFTINNRQNDTYQLDFKLFDSVPIKQVQVQTVERDFVIPGGMPFGIKMHTDGVIVVGMSDIQNGTETLNPAKDAGIKIGDILLSIDGEPMTCNTDVSHCISASSGQEVKVTLERDGQQMDLYVQPVKSEYDDGYKAGIWVRDSSAGIGTMTYYHPETGTFAGLGHAICDIDTGGIMPLSTGEIVDVNISGANVGHSGNPGELKGSFVGLEPIGELLINNETGVYGVLNQFSSLADPIPLAMKQDVIPGDAEIYCTLSGNKPQKFSIQIEKINYSDSAVTKSMVIRITDPQLLSATGGIVQGMSGSPILQNGKLIGAVTHVFVNDPTRGYGIFAENMEKTLKSVENNHFVA